jgi:hypothetical protein
MGIVVVDVRGLRHGCRHVVTVDVVVAEKNLM